MRLCKTFFQARHATVRRHLLGQSYTCILSVYIVLHMYRCLVFVRCMSGSTNTTKVMRSWSTDIVCYVLPQKRRMRGKAAIHPTDTWTTTEDWCRLADTDTTCMSGSTNTTKVMRSWSTDIVCYVLPQKRRMREKAAIHPT